MAGRRGTGEYLGGDRSGYVQVNGVALHQDFNHNDLYHVVQMGGMSLFYRGALVLKER
ncbi:MAG: hypothetical protein SGJ26_05485 [Nitrospirota bacterium]|nr:hypothetical protein [Nitrospirota bacterium]